MPSAFAAGSAAAGDVARVGTGDRAGRRIRRARRSAPAPARCEATGRARAGSTAADAVASDIVGLLAGVKSGGVPAGCDRRRPYPAGFWKPLCRRRDFVADRLLF